MDRIERLVAEVIAAFQEKRKRFPDGFAATLSEAGMRELGPNRTELVASALAVASWEIGPQELLERVRTRYANNESALEFDDVWEELVGLAQDGVPATLISEGIEPELATKAAQHIQLTSAPPRQPRQ